MTISLLRRGHPLASAAAQRAALAGACAEGAFETRLRGTGLYPLRREGVKILQINVGKICNQTCRHCHVDAGPDRRESMPRAVAERCLELLEKSNIPALDVTGGAPELHPMFREIVARARALGRRVIDRCNLTILLLRDGDGLAEFLAAARVEIVASLPYYLQRQTDSQRGDGVFERSIEAIRRLNALGYGREGSGLRLALVTNPTGAFLPGNQAAIERDWKRELLRRHGVVFDSLYTITNMPISRFLEYLIDSGNLESYLSRLVEAFNPAAAAGVMCRNTLSVGWNGVLYDCDFNQMLDIPVSSGGGKLQSIFDLDINDLAGRPIAVGPHCFCCTAGAGSGCGGALAQAPAAS